MNELIKKAIVGSGIFSREKGELDEIKGLTLATVTTAESSEGEIMVAVTFAESEKRFFASGKFADFITDNIELVVKKCNETDYDFTPYGIKVTYMGKKKSKNGRMFNDWSIEFPRITV